MRIVLIGPVRTKSHYGGVASFVEGLAEGFLQQGQDVFILSDYTDKEYTSEGVPVRAYGKKRERISPFYSPRMLRELKALKPDWIISSLHYAKINKEAKKFCRVMTFLHGFPSTVNLLKFLLIRSFSRSYAAHSHQIVTNSSLSQMVNRDILRVHTDAYVPLGIDKVSLAYFRTQRDRPKKKQVLFAGRIIPFKRVDQIIRGFLASSLGRMGYELVIVGSGRAEPRVRPLGEGQANIRFMGRLDARELWDCYLDAEIFISLSAHEPFGIVFVEALAGGCKVLAPQTGGHLDILKHFPESSILTDPYSVSAIAGDLDKVQALPLADRAVSLDRIQRGFTYENTASLLLKGMN